QVVPCHNGADLIEQAPFAAQTICEKAVFAPHGVRVARRALERPLEDGTTPPAERPAILLDDAVQVDGGQRLNGAAGIRGRSGSAMGTVADVTAESRLHLEAISLVQR